MQISQVARIAMTTKPGRLPLREETKELLEIRRKMKRDANYWKNLEFCELNKLIKKDKQKPIKKQVVAMIGEASKKIAD